MSGLCLYFDLMSQPSRAVYLFLKVNDIPFTEKPIALRKGEHFNDEYAKINPFKLVPAIDDSGFKLTESIAILKYLCDKRGLDKMYPRDLEKRSKVDQYLAWQHLNVRFGAAFTFQMRVIIPRAQNQPVDMNKVSFFKARLDQALDEIENIFLKDQDFLAGDDMTIADIHGICEMMQSIAAKYDIFTSDRPKLLAWQQRVKQRLHPYFEDAHKMVYRVRDTLPDLPGESKL